MYYSEYGFIETIRYEKLKQCEEMPVAVWIINVNSKGIVGKRSQLEIMFKYVQPSWIIS